MVSTKKFAVCLTLAGVFGLLTVGAANAQQFEMQPIQQQQKPFQPVPGVRYTTGAVVTQGWEQNLVKGNGNLSHFHWSPIVSYTQGMPAQKTRKQAVTAPPIQREFHYIKPTHVPNPGVYHPLPVAQKAQPGAFVHRDGKDVSASLSFKNREENVNGKLLNRKGETAAPATYGNYNRNSEASTDMMLARKEAYGQLLNR